MSAASYSPLLVARPRFEESGTPRWRPLQCTLDVAAPNEFRLCSWQPQRSHIDYFLSELHVSQESRHNPSAVASRHNSFRSTKFKPRLEGVFAPLSNLLSVRELLGGLFCEFNLLTHRVCRLEFRILNLASIICYTATRFKSQFLPTLYSGTTPNVYVWHPKSITNGFNFNADYFLSHFICTHFNRDSSDPKF